MKAALESLNQLAAQFQWMAQNVTIAKAREEGPILAQRRTDLASKRGEIREAVKRLEDFMNAELAG